MQFDVNEINRLIKQRRSIFPVHYSEEIVPDFIIEKMLENANWAPTHKFTEPWRFTVFSEEGINKLAEFQAATYKQVSEADKSFAQNKYEKLLNKPLKCSHIISIGMKREGAASVPEIEEVAAVAMAVQNMYLTATAYGVGCYWGSGGITYMEEAKSYFGLKPEDKLMGFLYVGMPNKEWPSSTRKPYQDKVAWVKG